MLFNRAVIVKAGASGGITITGGLDVADPPQGLDLLNDVSLMTGRVYFNKIYQLVRAGFSGILADSEFIGRYMSNECACF
jgi:hypothetical protein